MTYSPLQLDTIRKVVAAVDLMEQLCGDLKHLLAQSTRIQCRTYQIDRTPRGDEGKAVEHVHPVPLSGEPGFNAAMNALSDWYGHQDFSTKVVNRTPGALVVSNVDEPEVMRLVSEINRLKAAIEAMTPGLGSRDDRFELLHRHLHWLILTQLTRRLQVIPSSTPLQSCRFTWGIKTEIKKVTREDACAWLESRRKRPRRTLDEVPWDVKIDREMAAIRSLPGSADLRWRRVLRVRPLANLRFYSIDGEPPETYLREAHTPILILNPARRVKVGELRDYSAAERLGRERSKDRGEYERVSDLLPIYLRKTEADISLPDWRR